MSTPVYEFQTTADGEYDLIADGSLVIEAAHVRWFGDDLRGEVTITSETGITGPLELSFMNASNIQAVVNSISGDRQRVKEALSECCRRVVAEERNGSTTVVQLCNVQVSSENPEYEFDVLPSVPRTSMSIWFGDGGTGKSLAALYAAGQLVKPGIPTLYLDWEWDEGEHRTRLEQLFQDDMPQELFYWRCHQPLAQFGEAIRRQVRYHKIKYVVIDSIAYACGGSAEASDVAANYKRVVDQLGIGSLHLAHIPKGGDTSKPFGSVFWHNSARSTWYIKEESTKTHGPITSVELEWQHQKNNRGAKRSAKLMRFTVDRKANTIKFTDRFISNKSLSVPEQVRQHIDVSEARNCDDLRRLMPDVKPETLTRTVNRMSKEGKINEAPDGTLTLPAAH